MMHGNWTQLNEACTRGQGFGSVASLSSAVPATVLLFERGYFFACLRFEICFNMRPRHQRDEHNIDPSYTLDLGAYPWNRATRSGVLLLQASDLRI